MSGNPRTIDHLDLSGLRLASGAARDLAIAVPVAPFRLGGQEYSVVPRPLPIELSIAAAAGRHFQIRGSAELIGPCWRCLGEARLPIALAADEYHEAGAGPELRSDYVVDEELRLSDWVRDAVADDLPPRILCRDDCAGTCPGCGADLNAQECACEVASAIDPRWAPLADLARSLGARDGNGRRDD